MLKKTKTFLDKLLESKNHFMEDDEDFTKTFTPKSKFSRVFDDME